MIVVEVGYGGSFVMSKEDALAFAGILERAERYEQKYWSKSERESRGMPSDVDYTYHVYPNDQAVGMKIISNDMYNMAKLAGKPERG